MIDQFEDMARACFAPTLRLLCRQVKNARAMLDAEKQASDDRRSAQQRDRRGSLFGSLSSSSRLGGHQRTPSSGGGGTTTTSRFSDNFIANLGPREKSSSGGGNSGEGSDQSSLARTRRASAPFLARALSSVLGSAAAAPGQSALDRATRRYSSAFTPAGRGARAFAGLGEGPSPLAKPMGPAEKLRHALVTSRTVWALEFGLAGPLGAEKRRRAAANAVANALVNAAETGDERHAAAAAASASVVAERADPPLLEAAVVGGTVKAQSEAKA